LPLKTINDDDLCNHVLDTSRWYQPCRNCTAVKTGGMAILQIPQD
jgi:hypothetical protein